MYLTFASLRAFEGPSEGQIAGCRNGGYLHNGSVSRIRCLLQQRTDWRTKAYAPIKLRVCYFSMLGMVVST